METLIRGMEYRRQKLLDFVGSQQRQSGVIWGSRVAGALICTTGGRHGRKAGYIDEPLADGSWHYFGQGVEGSQSLNNPANARLAHPDTTVFLFTSREPSSTEISKAGGYGKLYRYMGQFRVVGFEQHRPNFGVRKNDTLLRFRLLPIELEGEPSNYELNELNSSCSEVKKWLFDDESSPPQHGISIRRYWLRCQAIKRYVILRSGGFCEGCELRAPFLRPDKSAYLEIHHIHRLADAGPDNPENVVALCANCHRRAHFGEDAITFNARLKSKILDKEKILNDEGGAHLTPRDQE